MVKCRINLTMATDILESAPWSMVKVVILWSNFEVNSKVYLFDQRKFVLGHGQNGYFCDLKFRV